MNNFKLKQNGAQVQKAIDYALQVPQLSEAIADLGGKGELYVSIPDCVDIKTNSEFRVYFRNILSRDDVMLLV